MAVGESLAGVDARGDAGRSVVSGEPVRASLVVASEAVGSRLVVVSSQAVGAGGAGGGGVVVGGLEVELLKESLGGSIDLAAAIALGKDARRLVSEVRLEVSSSLDEAVGG